MATNEHDEIVLQNTFYLHEGPRCHLTLDRHGLTYRKLNFTKNETEKISIVDIIGCQCMRDRPKKVVYNLSCNSFTETNQTNQTKNENGDQMDESNKIYVCFYCYPLRRKRMGKKLVRTRTTLIFLVDYHTKSRDNLILAEKWKNTTVALVRQQTIHSSASLNTKCRKLLIFVNPRSGPGKALQIFEQRVVPVLAEADIEYSLVVTDKSNHAREFVATCKNLNYWDGIVIVSGDGLLFEVFNGLMERYDWDTSIKTPVGVVPGGSGNGLARAIGHALKEPYLQHAILSSTLNLVSGRTKTMDLIRVEMQNKSCYSFLSIGWGLLADIDIESEKLRAIGEPRFALWSLAKIIGLRAYHGRVSYDPAEMEPNSTPLTPLHPLPTRSNTVPYDEHEFDPQSVRRTQSLSDFQREHSSSIDCEDAVSIRPTEETRPNRRISYTSNLPKLDEPVPNSWITIDDHFLLVYVVYQTHIGSDVFCAPLARLDDGIMWLLVVRKGASRKQLLTFMLSLESGEHTKCPFVDMIPISAVRIEPFTGDGHMTVDGESIECGPLQAEVLPSLARVMVR